MRREGFTVNYILRTFGCRVNQAESDELRRRLASAGWSEARGLDEAEVCIVNTCTVTRDADREALKFIRRASRANPSARLVVTGCLAERSPQAVRSCAPSAQIVPNRDKDGLTDILGLPRRAPQPESGDRGRAFLKVQDGCDGACAYCVVPQVRPRLRSLPSAEVLARARAHVARGVPEIVLCGIRLGRYRDGDVGLAGILERLLLLPGRFRIRLSSLEIADAGEALARVIAGSSGRVCPHLHIPLQSGSEATLRRMSRPYTAAVFARRAEALRRRIPGLALFTDILTGFPGETDMESRESLDFVRGLGLRGLHVFRYSARDGTAAASMPEQVPSAKARERLEPWQELDRSLRQEHRRSAAGQERVAAPLKNGVDAVTEDFLSARLDRPQAPGLWRVQVDGAEGGKARARVLGEWSP